MTESGPDARWLETAGPALANALAEGGDVADLLTRADVLAPGPRARLGQAATRAVANRPDARPGLEARLAAGGDGETLLGLGLAARLFDGDLAGAAALAERLAGVAEPAPWSGRLRARLAALRGDLPAAARLLEAVIDRHGEAWSVNAELASLLYCLGRRAAASDVLRRGFATIPPVELGRRQAAVRSFAETLERAAAERWPDGRGEGDIGSRANYTGAGRVREAWRRHRGEATAENTYRTVAAHTNTLMFDAVERQLAEDPGLAKVVNYGTLCGVREAALAARHPERIWAGYDISETATALNREAFAADNLVFDSDLEGLLDGLAASRGETLLIHCRTADVMFPEALRAVYRACAEAGVRHILAAEYFSYALLQEDFPDFAGRDRDRDTVQMDGIVMMHNYARLMPECGYRIVSDTFLPVPLPVSASGEGRFGDQMIRLVQAERMA